MNLSDNRLKCCIAITVNNKVYMYKSRAAITLAESARDDNQEWEGWEEFHDQLDAREMVATASSLGVKLKFKKGDKTELSMEVWEALCNLADDRRSAMETALPKRHPVTGEKIAQRGRKPQNLGARRYEILIPEDKKTDRVALVLWCPCTTKQAITIWKFFVDEYLSTGSTTVTESRMADIVNDRQAELNTKQDPWRIFQYYRPELIQCKLIRLVK